MKITKLIFIAVGVLIILAVANLVLLFPNTKKLLKLATEKEQAKPPSFALTTIAPENCPECFTTAPLIDALKKQNVSVGSERFLNASDAEAQSLIAQYKIEKLPTLIVKGDFGKQAELKKQLETIGTVTGDTFLWTSVQPPYKEITTGNIRGKFSATYITDTTCKTCYDVMRHQQAMANLGLKAADDKVVDIRSADGKKLQQQYALTVVPTVILTGDLAMYDSLKAVWPSVGTIEKDGTYIFRENGIVAAQMGAYRNLKTGKIVSPTPPPAPANTNGK
ncbi:hypothetical protein HY625_00490 [Candidatus Uhrbacteria bacterium]|nr:hypothetical protein [Candidatus Uhrbacteria bacterium]